MPELTEFNIRNNEYYSVFVKLGDESDYYLKGTDVNGNKKLIRAYNEDETHAMQDASSRVTLPEYVIDFDLCGEKNKKGKFELLMITSSNKSYLYKLNDNFGPYRTYKLIETD